MKVLKYPLEITDSQVIKLPQYATLLTVKNQRERLVLYAIVEEAPVATVPVTIHIVGTGHSFAADERIYLGTVLMHGGSLVWHVFVEPRSDIFV
jgi:hypothetical protein